MNDYNRFACIFLEKVRKSKAKNDNLGENFIDFNKANLFILRRLVAIWMLFLGVGIGDLSTVKLGESVYHGELKYTASGVDHDARWVNKGGEYHYGVLEFIAYNIKRMLCLPIREDWEC